LLRNRGISIIEIGFAVLFRDWDAVAEAACGAGEIRETDEMRKFTVTATRTLSGNIPSIPRRYAKRMWASLVPRRTQL
jgi:hypothetical protein